MERVLLFLPEYPGQPLGPPAGLLCLASVLLKEGYQVEIIDPAIVPDYLSAIAARLDDAICFGISLLTGPMIASAVKASRMVKQIRPHLPVIFGGWHPSLLVEQTLREPFVDIIIRNQGELTLLEVLQRISAGNGFDGVAGCSYKTGGILRHNPDRPIVPLTSLPMPAYELVDFDAYEKITGERKLPYASSVGCPYACSYCTDSVFYGRKFNAQSAQRVIKEVTHLVATHHLREVALLDSNFLVDNRRALDIARGFIDSSLKFHWTFQTSTDLMRRLSDDDAVLLGRSGVTRIGFGVESGSARVLQAMNKPHQNMRDAFETARKCRKAGIRATYNLIFGFPHETEADLYQTFRAMGNIASQFENLSFSANIFTPYPGIPIWPELKALGVKEPSKLEDWTSLSLGTNVLPWLNETTCRRITKAMAFFAFRSKVAKAMGGDSLSPRTRWIMRAVLKLLHSRLKHHFFDWPLEQRLIGNRTRLMV